mgnify:CR=1 FL=1|jgi:hemerythrin-like metal-binding protein
MAVLQWEDRFGLGVDAMDDTHREFIDLLAALVQADAGGAPEALDRLIEHTDAHFAQEDLWMVESGWGPPCHTGEHRQVLELMREVRRRAQAGEAQLIEVLARELGPWFEHHASTMDTMLASHMAQAGYQPQRLAERGDTPLEPTA